MDLENNFIKDSIDSCRFTVICGGKGSGKSHAFLAYFKLFYHHGKYDEYILILPELDTEVDKKYDFLRSLNNVTIYTEYDKTIFDYVKALTKTKKVFLCFDDATNAMFKNKNDETITKLASTTRHGKGCALFLITHALSNILLPHVRSLIDHLFIGVFSNMRIIKNSLWQENLSLVIDWKEFMEMYKTQIVDREEDHPFLYLNRKRQYDYNVHQWEMMTYYDMKLPSNGKAKIRQVDHEKELRERLQEDAHKAELRKQYKPKKFVIQKKFLGYK